RLLVVITARKAAHLIRDQRRRKRGGAAQAADEPDLGQVLSREPSPAFAAQMADEIRRLLRNLGDCDLEAGALAKREGCSVDEIAARLGFAPRSVKRKLHLIRSIWEREVGP